MSKKTAWITGASRGFGRLTAERFAKEGYTVFACIRHASGKNRDAAESFRAWARENHLDVHVIELDVTVDASVEVAVQSALEWAPHLDVVVNNAGVMGAGLTEAYSASLTRSMFEINVFGAQRVCRAVLPHMRRRGQGLIVHVTSAVGRVALPCMGIYCASKFALEALAESYRYELQPLGIDVAIVEPGAYPTGIDKRSLMPDDSVRLAEYGDLFGAQSSSSRKSPWASGRSARSSDRCSPTASQASTARPTTLLPPR
jgi:NAD(P)-dependent dehydrogenase (short-subunit alcohol dehydrogenase family)